MTVPVRARPQEVMGAQLSWWPRRPVHPHVVFLGVGLLAVGLFLQGGRLNEAISVMGAAAIAYPLSILSRLTGVVSLAAAPLALAGGFAGGYFSSQLGLPFPLVLVLAGLVGASIGVLMALPARNWTLLYTVVVTLAAVYIVNYAVARLGTAIGHPTGMIYGDTRFVGIDLGTPRTMYFALLVLLLLNLHVAFVAPRTHEGRRWMADAADRNFAAALGISHPATIIQAFAASSALIAVAGALNGYWVGVVEHLSYNIVFSIEFLAIIVLGGLASPWGALLGATIYVVLPTALGEVVATLLGESSAASQIGANLGHAVFGVLVILTVLYQPRGLAGVLRATFQWVRRLALRGRAT